MVLAQKNRHVNQWDRIKRPEMSPHLHAQLLYDKGGKNVQ